MKFRTNFFPAIIMATVCSLSLLYWSLGKIVFRIGVVYAESNNSVIVRGYVHDSNGPVTGALVKVNSESITTTTSSDGSFQLGAFEVETPITITSWAPGYYNHYTEFLVQVGSILEISIEPYSSNDNVDYEWLTADLTEGQERNCISCHSDAEHPEKHLTYDDWIQSAHGRSATNPLFLSLYQGSDLDGNISPATRYNTNQDYGRYPLLPDPSKAYFGPGYKLDFPKTEGSCATCHIPYAAVDDPYGVNPLQVSQLATEGVGCDFCHKIKQVILDRQNMPIDGNHGVLSYQLARPESNRNLFLGPFDDMAPGDDSFSPLYQQGQICAGCHYGKFWDVVVYNSYGEWLQSDYSNPLTGKACQQCHMPTGLTDRVVTVESGGKSRDPDRIHSHAFIGGENVNLLRSAVDLRLSAFSEDGKVTVDVVIRNENAGHHFPTGSPLRHLVLVVEALDKNGKPLMQISGNKTPEWAGKYSGQPGTVYAKVLEELWTGVYPTAAFWNQTIIRSDNRIPANAEDQQKFVFSSSVNSQDRDNELDEVSIRATLVYRRHYEALQKVKKWPEQDVLLGEESLVLGKH